MRYRKASERKKQNQTYPDSHVSFGCVLTTFTLQMADELLKEIPSAVLRSKEQATSVNCLDCCCDTCIACEKTFLVFILFTSYGALGGPSPFPRTCLSVVRWLPSICSIDDVSKQTEHPIQLVVSSSLLFGQNGMHKRALDLIRLCLAQASASTQTKKIEDMCKVSFYWNMMEYVGMQVSLQH